MTEKTYLKKKEKCGKKFDFFLGLCERIRDEKIKECRSEYEQSLWIGIMTWAWDKADKWLKKEYDLFRSFYLEKN